MDNRVTAEQMEILREYVTFWDENAKKNWSCRRCKQESKGGRPNRIVAHLLGVKGKGIKPCGHMADAEREELSRRLRQNPQIDITDQICRLGDIMGDPILTPPYVSFDHMYHQYELALQEGATNTSSFGDASGSGGIASTPGLAEPPPCPPNFPSDLWDLYVKIDGESLPSLTSPFALHKYCTTSTAIEEKDRKDRLDALVSACSDVRNYLTNALDNTDREYLQKRLYDCFYQNKYGILNRWLSHVTETERKIREEAEQEVILLGTKRQMEMNSWLAYVARIKIEGKTLVLDAARAISPSEILPLLKRIDELTIGLQKLNEMGMSFLNPVPADVLSWNPSFLYRGTHLQNHTPPGQLPQQV